jgi:hypothetical protein
MLAPRLEEKLTKFGIRFNHNKSEHIIYTSNSQIGDFVFRSADRPERIIAYQSYRAHVDELDTLKPDHARDVWRKVLERNRQAPSNISDENKVLSKITGKLEIFNRAYAYTSPEGFRFVYDTWKKNGWDSETRKGDINYQLLQVSTRSNPFNPPDYVDSIKSRYSEALANAYIDGQFVNLTSGSVYNSYNRELCRSHEQVQPNEVLYIGCDFNVQRMCYTVYVLRDAGKTWHAVEEGHNLYNTADVIRSLNERYKYKGNRCVVYPDATGDHRKSSAAKTDIALLRDAGYEIRAPRKNPDVRDRVQCMNGAFSNRRLFVNDATAPNVANCLEQQSYNSKGEPDKDGKLDDQNDASGYPIAYELPIRKPVFKFEFDFSLAHKY